MGLDGTNAKNLDYRTTSLLKNETVRVFFGKKRERVREREKTREVTGKTEENLGERTVVVS
jgi:hypothetical protein